MLKIEKFLCVRNEDGEEIIRRGEKQKLRGEKEKEREEERRYII